MPGYGEGQGLDGYFIPDPMCSAAVGCSECAQCFFVDGDTEAYDWPQYPYPDPGPTPCPAPPPDFHPMLSRKAILFLLGKDGGCDQEPVCSTELLVDFEGEKYPCFSDAFDHYCRTPCVPAPTTLPLPCPYTLPLPCPSRPPLSLPSLNACASLECALAAFTYSTPFL